MHLWNRWLVPVSVIFLMSGMQPSPSDAQWIVAHRGASHDAPENTLAAFELAWRQGADAIEGDFCLSADGRIVCIHDDTTERTAGIDRVVSECSLAELKQLDVGSWHDATFANQRIPTLEEVLATVPDGKRIVIELKIGPEIVAPLQAILDESSLRPEQVLIISFQQATVARAKQVLPGFKAHWLSSYDPDAATGQWVPNCAGVVQTIRQTGADGFGSKGNREVFDESFVRQMQQSGIDDFHVWTIDDPEDARFYQRLGASAITTNRPALIRQALFGD